MLPTFKLEATKHFIDVEWIGKYVRLRRDILTQHGHILRTAPLRPLNKHIERIYP